MSVAKRAMVLFLGQLKKWEKFIKSATHANELQYQVGDSGDLTVIVKWVDKTGLPGEFRKVIARSDIYPVISTRGARPRTRPCRVADDIIMDVLKARGVK